MKYQPTFEAEMILIFFMIFIVIFIGTFLGYVRECEHKKRRDEKLQKRKKKDGN